MSLVKSWLFEGYNNYCRQDPVESAINFRQILFERK